MRNRYDRNYGRENQGGYGRNDRSRGGYDRDDFQQGFRGQGSRYGGQSEGFGGPGGYDRDEGYFGGGRQGYGEGYSGSGSGGYQQSWRDASFGNGEDSYGGDYRRGGGGRGSYDRGRDSYRGQGDHQGGYSQSSYTSGPASSFGGSYGGGSYDRGGDDYNSGRGAYRGQASGRYGGDYSSDYPRSEEGFRGDDRGERGWFDRASDEVMSWFGDEDAERRREMDERSNSGGYSSHRGRGPKNYQRSDDRIKEDINDRLTDDYMLDASDIDVEVSDREVTLTGTVSSRRAKRRAEDVAEMVSGVSNVENRLRVRDRSTTSQFGETANETSYKSQAASAGGGSSQSFGSQSSSTATSTGTKQNKSGSN